MTYTFFTRHSKRRLYKKCVAYLFFATFILAGTLFTGCSKGYSRFLKLPSDPSIASGLGWAVVTSAYAHAKKLPDRQSPDVAVVRRGSMFRCTLRKIDPEGQDSGGLWYDYSDGSIDGWIHSGDLSIFSSEEQARGVVGTLQQE
jgi:hypothetical protein